MPNETGLSGASGSGGGGGGGGDASASNQVLGLTALDQIYDALVLVGTEATSADILAAVQSLTNGATLDDLAAALAPLATEATQQDVLAALEAQAIDVGLIQSNVALLVPDVDAMRVSLASIDGKIPASPAQDRTTFGAPSAVRIANAGASAFVTPFVSGDAVAQSGTWNINNVSGTISLPTGAATSAKQPALGTAGSASTDVITVQGIAGGTALPVSLSGTVTVDSEMSAAVAAGAGMANPTAGGVIAYGAVYRSDTGLWTRMEGNGSGLYVQGNTAVGVSLNHNPLVMGGCNSSTVTRIQTDSTGRLRVGVMGEAPLAADATTDVWIRVPAGNGRTAATSGVGVILASAGRLRSARVSMTNANNVWIAFHNAASGTTATEANMLAGPWNVSGVGAYVNYEPPIAEACTAGCKVVAWTDASMATIDTAATFTFYARAM